MDKAFLVGDPFFLSSQLSRGSGEVSLCLMTQLLSLTGTQGWGPQQILALVPILCSGLLSRADLKCQARLACPAECGVGFVSKWTVLRLV